MIWPTLKRLRFLERERIVNMKHIAALLDDLWETRARLAESMRAESNLLAQISRLESEKEIEGLLKEAAE